MTITHRSKEIEIERKGHQITMRHGELAHDWLPLASTGLSREEIRQEFGQALDRFSDLIDAHQQTSAHLDEMFSDTTSASSEQSSTHAESSVDPAQSSISAEPNDDAGRSA